MLRLPMRDLRFVMRPLSGTRATTTAIIGPTMAKRDTWIKAGGNDPGESTPMDLDALAARHPAVECAATLGGRALIPSWIGARLPLKSLAVQTTGPKLHPWRRAEVGHGWHR